MKELLDSVYAFVSLEKIQFPERPNDTTSKELVFFNPRSLESFDDASMQSLLESILEDGLQQPPIVRILNEGTDNEVYQLVAGERRVRCLKKAFANNYLIFDEKSGEKRPAKEVIECIPCHIHRNCDDEKALRLAFNENAKHKSLSPKEDIALVERLSQIFDSQGDICRILGTNPTWVSQTLSFREKLPPEAFEKLQKGLMNRSVAVQLLSLKEEDRMIIFNQMIEEEESQRELLQTEAQEALELAEIEEEVAEAQVELVEGEKEAKKVKKIAKKASQAKQKAQEKLGRIDKDAGKLTQGHFEKATSKKQVSAKTPKILGKNHIESMIALCDQWIDEPKKDPVCKEIFPADDLKIARLILNAILNGDPDLGRAFRAYYITAGIWEDSTEIIDDEESEETDVDEDEIDEREFDIEDEDEELVAAIDDDEFEDDED